MIEVKYTGPEGWGDKAYAGDAGIDLPLVKEHILAPGEFADLPSGIRVAIPEGYYGRIVARSSALRKRRVRVYEGIIDAGFRGELFTYVENIGPSATKLEPGDRLAQMIISPVMDTTFTVTDLLPESERGTKGFGSSDSRTVDRLRASVDAIKRPATIHTIYLGGPIDYRAGKPWWAAKNVEVPDGNWSLYDPQAANAGEADPSTIWNRNMTVLLEADLAIFVFLDGPGTYGFGSPIEIAERCMKAEGKPTIVYVEGHEPGVYLRKLWQDHALILTDNWKDTRRLIAEELSKIG